MRERAARSSRKPWFMALAALLAIAPLACVDGGSSEQENAVASGMVRDAGGQPVAGARVRVRSQDYLRDTALGPGDGGGDAEARTGEDGGFVLPLPGEGAYSIEVRDGQGRIGVNTVTVSTQGGRLRLAPTVVRAPVRVGGRVALSNARRAFVQIRGLERLAVTDSLGHFDLGDMPAGSFRLRLVAGGSASKDLGLSVPAGAPGVDLGRLVANGKCLDTVCEAAALRALFDTGAAEDTVGRVDWNPATGKVVGLDLSGLGADVSTTWWDDVGRFPALQELSLAENALTGVPAVVGTLDSLYSLDLSSNRLDSIPEALARLPRLDAINLSENRIAAWPQVPGGFAPLRHLDLSNNRMALLPPAVANLGGLLTLDLSGNLLSDLPSGIAGPQGLVKIIDLFVDGNRICAPSPELRAFLAEKDSTFPGDQACGR